ncbi:MAG: hypothetical protein SGBAC_000324 [Bacillariaceae sp.]
MNPKRSKKRRIQADGTIESSEVDAAPPTKLAGLSSNEKCEMIAELSETILEDPTKGFKKERDTAASVEEGGDSTTTVRVPSKVEKLLDLARPHKNGEDEYIATLGVMSLLAIFKDVLPSYRIRLPTDAERAGKVSKETKQLWDYERAILTYYQHYLQLLEKQWERGQNGPSRLGMTCILSLCELLKIGYHFNFRSNLLTMVVRQMNNRSCEKVSEACCQAIEHVFAKDAQGEVSMEAARLVSKLIKDYKGVLLPNVVRTFIRLPLRVHVDEAQAAKLASQANKKKRKKDRELAEIEDELKEGSGTVDKIVLARCQSETLQSVILTYFRILKSADSKTKKDLLPVALEGLAKFVHLINMDTVVDLLDVLKQLLTDVDNMPLEASLNCALTAFQALQGPGREMQIDQKEYITPLYSQLARLGTDENSRPNTERMIKCLTSAFIQRREYSTVRIAAFIKQIFTVALHAPPYTSVPLMAVARQILQRYSSVHQMLDSESDVITSGQYTPDVQDPEHSNPFSTSAWELATLKFHVNPAVQTQANAASTLKLLQMPGESPQRLWPDMLRDADEVYIECRRIQKRHPLSAKGNRQQYRFIRPRKTEITLLDMPKEDQINRIKRMPSSIDDFAATIVETVDSTASSLLDEDTAGKVIDTVENTMMPYLVAGASFVHGVVFPADGEKSPAPAKAVVRSSGSGSITPMFFYGMCRFLEVVSLLTFAFSTRVADKMRLAFYSWLYDTPKDKPESPENQYRDPTPLQELDGTPMPGSEKEENAGILKELLSPDWALTPNLHIAMLTLPFGSELNPTSAAGVEFYYVIEGDGTYTQTIDGKPSKAKRISSGNGFIVDPGTVRGFAANGRGQLVLLRATDSSIIEGYDVETNPISSNKAIVTAGMGKIEGLIKKYSQKEDFEEVSKPNGN